MRTPFLSRLSHFCGWLADLRLPGPLRAPIYRTYAKAYGVNLDELRLALSAHPSLSAFFVRRLKDGARVFADDPRLLPSPADGRFQAIDPVREGTILQAKGQPYPVRELLAGADEGVDLEGGWAWTIYLSPRDYHRVHAPEACELEQVRWAAGSRYSVQPKVLLKRPGVLAGNERAVLRLATATSPLFLVMVGALNVGRIRVVGVEHGDRHPRTPKSFARGGELARFEMGSTVVLIAPPGGPRPVEGLGLGDAIRMGSPIGRRP